MKLLSCYRLFLSTHLLVLLHRLLNHPCFDYTTSKNPQVRVGITWGYFGPLTLLWFIPGRPRSVTHLTQIGARRLEGLLSLRNDPFKVEVILINLKPWRNFKCERVSKARNFCYTGSSIAEIITYLGAVWSTFLCPNWPYYITQEKICQHYLLLFLKNSTKYHP